MNINQLKGASGEVKDYNEVLLQTARRLHIVSGNMSENVNDESARAKKEAKIRAKLEAGVPLTRKEMEFLRKYNPQLYAIALRVEIKRKSLEDRLSHAKSKSEVQDIQLEAMATIRRDDPAKKYMVAAVEETMKEFKETQVYKRLPDTKEEAKKCHTRVVYEFGTGTGADAYQMVFIEN